MNKRGVIRVAMGEVVSEAVYPAVSIAGQHIVDNAVYIAVYTAVGSAVTDALCTTYRTTVFDLTSIDKVRELI